MQTNTNPPDYVKRFERIAQYTYLSKRAKSFFLAEELDGIFKSFGSKVFEEYAKRYVSITEDESFVKAFMLRNNIDFTMREKLWLEDLDGRETDLNQLLKKNQGKVVLIDFWASWCAPCRAAMPKGLMLQETYAARNDFLFLYLSVDENKEAWSKAVVQLNLNPKNCYRLTNKNSSDFVAKYDIRSIPRYMLLDKKGNVAIERLGNFHTFVENNEIRKWFKTE